MRLRLLIRFIRYLQKNRSSIQKVVLPYFILCLFFTLLISSNWFKATAADKSSVDLVTIKVEHGDTLWSIAKNYGDPNQYILKRMTIIQEINNLENGHILKEGDTLLVPINSKSQGGRNGIERKAS